MEEIIKRIRVLDTDLHLLEIEIRKTEERMKLDRESLKEMKERKAILKKEQTKLVKKVHDNEAKHRS